MAKSSVSRTRGKAAVVISTTTKPPKPYPEFPLLPHPSGHWAKKIKGRLYYFGPWGKRHNGKLERLDGDGWQQALERYKAEIDNIHAGRPRKAAAVEGITVAELCEHFLNAKRVLQENGEITPRTFADYRQTTDRIVETFSGSRVVSTLTTDDWARLRAKIASTNGVVRLANGLRTTRMVFKYGMDAGLIGPPRYGASFKPPAKHVLRKARAEKGERMLEPADLRLLLDAASPQLKAMLLLALNAGLGNSDCAGLETGHLDLERGWLSYARAKTGIPRRAKLWPETVEALRLVLGQRKAAKDPADAGLVFLTRTGARWVKQRQDGKPDDAIAKETRKLLDETGLYRPGISFYALRHVFRTVADGSRDFPAVRLVMGHADSSIDGIYRERIEDERLQAVAEHVRAWLFPPKAKRARRAGR